MYQAISHNSFCQSETYSRPLANHELRFLHNLVCIGCSCNVFCAVKSYSFVEHITSIASDRSLRRHSFVEHITSIASDRPLRRQEAF